jgi:hypothetical protein
VNKFTQVRISEVVRAVLDLETGRPLPDNHPVMAAVGARRRWRSVKRSIGVAARTRGGTRI